MLHFSSCLGFRGAGGNAAQGSWVLDFRSSKEWRFETWTGIRCPVSPGSFCFRAIVHLFGVSGCSGELGLGNCEMDR